MLIDLRFPHSYAARDIASLPMHSAGIPTLTFQSDTPGSPLPRMAVHVTPRGGEEWIGRFDPGYDEPPAISGIFSTPNPDRCCVVSAGRGYIVNVFKPSEYSDAGCFPILAVVQATRSSRIVFADFTQLVAWDSSTKIWESARVSLDGIEVVGLRDSTLRCRGTDISESFEFKINVQDGKVISGARRFGIDHPPFQR
jgi:hypothetical protein